MLFSDIYRRIYEYTQGRLLQSKMHTGWKGELDSGANNQTIYRGFRRLQIRRSWAYRDHQETTQHLALKKSVQNGAFF